MKREEAQYALKQIEDMVSIMTDRGNVDIDLELHEAIYEAIRPILLERASWRNEQ